MDISVEPSFVLPLFCLLVFVVCRSVFGFGFEKIVFDMIDLWVCV